MQVNLHVQVVAGEGPFAGPDLSVLSCYVGPYQVTWQSATGGAVANGGVLEYESQEPYEFTATGTVQDEVSAYGFVSGERVTDNYHRLVMTFTFGADGESGSTEQYETPTFDAAFLVPITWAIAPGAFWSGHNQTYEIP